MPLCRRGELPGPQEGQGQSGSGTSGSVSGPLSLPTTPATHKSRENVSKPTKHPQVAADAPAGVLTPRKTQHSDTHAKCPLTAAQHLRWPSDFSNRRVKYFPLITLRGKKQISRLRQCVFLCLLPTWSPEPEFPPLPVSHHAKRIPWEAVIHSDNIFQVFWAELPTPSPPRFSLSGAFSV